MRTIAIVQARMGSTRLPNKVMKKIASVPMIELLLRRLSLATQIDQIIVATSIDKANTPLVEHVSKLGYKVFSQYLIMTLTSIITYLILRICF